MEIGDQLLQNLNSTEQDAKYNIFDFQKHLANQIMLIGNFFLTKDYTAAFECLQTLYADCNGFFTIEGEKENLDVSYKAALAENVKFIQAGRLAGNIGIYAALIDFRFKLMASMCKHQLLIPVEKKDYYGMFK